MSLDARQKDNAQRDLALVGVGVVTVGLVLFESAWKFGSYQDDAFIYFRYAENLVHGQGLVFNPGERVEGFTSPLWMLLLVATTALRISPFLAAGVLGTFSAAATVLLSLDDARRSGPPGVFGALAPIALATWIPLVLWGASGLETCLFTALLLAAFASYRAFVVGLSQSPPSSGRALALGALLAATLLARPEGALAVVTIGGAVALRKNARAAALVLALPLLAATGLVAARALYYHDVLPNPFYAKLGGTLAHYTLGVRYVARFVAAVPLVWLAPLLLVRRGWSGVRGIGALVAFLGLWAANVIRTGGDYFQYFRFLVPVAPLLFALGAHGAYHACRLLGAVAGSKLPRTWEPAAAVALALAVIALQYDRIADHPQHGLEWATRWAKLGRALGRALPPGTTVAAPNIGAVGYYSGLPIVDLLGLVDRELARRPRTMRANETLSAGDVGHDSFDVAYSMSKNPQAVVFMHALSAEPFTDRSEIPADLWVERRLAEYLAKHPEYELLRLPVDANQYWGVFIRSDSRAPLQALPRD
jgi:hypothetical protein